jgi:carbonic anhydrase/acetyltransferase-like protein (isoleucine patch superfamily)
MADGYRSLSIGEIRGLEASGCRSNSWESVFVKEPFNAERIQNVTFSGTVRLGHFNGTARERCGLPLLHGIKNAHIHNCTIGDNVTITDITGFIANYDIGEGVVIRNCGHISTEGRTSFGNGTRVAVLNETGGREVPIWDRLTSHMAYIITLYRHRPAAIEVIEKLIGDYTEQVKSDRGEIGAGSYIAGCGTIKNVRVGNGAVIEDVSRLAEGSVNSTFKDPVFIGNDVIMDHFIICSGSKVNDAAVIDKCFIGQGCTLSKQYSAENSLFFANCGGYHGEACSIFAGPFTVTHHKSTLLIAGIFSFMNAGSGSNQSNHMYKLGPIHQGIMERGSKTTSDSYVLWPSRIGPFTLVVGRHYHNVDTTQFPFSYLTEVSYESQLIPGINLRSVGTIRDAQKWPKRDARKDQKKLDQINYNLLSPFTVGKMMKGRELLRMLLSDHPGEQFIYFDRMRMKTSAAERGITLYQMGIDKFIGNSVIKRLEGTEFISDDEIRARMKPGCDEGTGDWIDMSGLITPLSAIETLLSEIEKREMKNADAVNRSFESIHKRYYELEWAWVYDRLPEETGKPNEELTAADIIEIVERWKKSVVDLDRMLYEDARKEFTLSSMTGFGIDGDDEVKKRDFEQVRGDFEKNSVVLAILDHIRDKTELGDELIGRMRRHQSGSRQ